MHIFHLASTKILFVSCLCLVILCGQAKNASAYDNDTHFWLTYYLALKAKYTPLQATQIASANISVDFDSDTQPVLPRPTIGDLNKLTSHLSIVRMNYHALVSKSDANRLLKPEQIFWWDPAIENDPVNQRYIRELVILQRNILWNNHLREKRNPGFFLHYLQDMYAHRDFKSFVGHAGYKRVDFLASDRPKAKEMAMETMKYLYAYREYINNRLTLDEIVNAHQISVDKFLTTSEIGEIEGMVEKFCDANKSDGVEPNDLITFWTNLPSKNGYNNANFPALKYALELIKISKITEVPDSSKARDLILQYTKPLNYETPKMWVYDYKQNLIDIGLSTSTARSYKTSLYQNALFYSENEQNNMSETTAFDTSITPKRRQCMPYQLVADSQKTTPLCK